MYNPASADGSRYRARTFNANKRLDTPCNQLVVSLAAIWGVDILHDDVADDTDGGVSLEIRVDSRDTHAGQ